MGFTIRPLPHGLTVTPPRSRALLLFGAAAWNFVLPTVSGTWALRLTTALNLFVIVGVLAGLVFLFFAVRALVPTRIEWSGGRFRCRPPLPWPRAVDLPLAEVEDVHFGPKPRRQGHPRQVVTVRTTAGEHRELPLLLDSFTAAANGNGAILIDGRATPEAVHELVERIRTGLDGARRETVDYRRVAAGPEPS